VSPYIGKNNWHDFSYAELYPVLCQQFLHFFLVSTNSFFHEKSLLSNFNPPLLHSYRQNPNIEPRTAYFSPAMPTIFANTANPVFIPVSIFHQTMVEELRGAGGCERVRI